MKKGKAELFLPSLKRLTNYSRYVLPYPERLELRLCQMGSIWHRLCYHQLRSLCEDRPS
jgi:hypothetical protein